MPCCTLLYVPSSFAIILTGKRELAALSSLFSWCLVVVVWLFLVVSWVCLQFVVMVFPGHTHLLFSLAICLKAPVNQLSSRVSLTVWLNLNLLLILASIGYAQYTGSF